MCTKGGKRCDTHKDGSKATVTLTSKIAEVQEAVVRKIFVLLKKEGKGLEAPEKEEVVNYAETGKFLTKYDPNMTERQKKSLMRQFESSKEENPSGPLFHAWKHTLPEALRRTRKTMMATGLASVILLTSACGGSPSGDPMPSATSTASPTTITATPTPSASEAPSSVVAGTVVNGMPTKKTLASNSKGKYVQTTISPDDPALQYNQGIVDQSAFKYTPEEITSVQKQVATFVAEEGIDSSINDTNDPKDLEDWWSRNKAQFHPDTLDSMHAAAVSNDPTKPLVFQSQFRAGKYNLQYGDNVAHVTSRKITPTKVVGGEIRGKDAMGFEFQVDFNLAANVDGKVQNEHTTGIVAYTLVKDATTGKFLISGSNNTFSTTPLK